MIRILTRLALDLAVNAAVTAYDAARELRCQLVCNRHQHAALLERCERLQKDVDAARKVNLYVNAARERRSCS